MIKSKYTSALAILMAGIALAIAIGLVVAADSETKPVLNQTQAEYVEALFGTDIISIEILADEKEWQTMLDNAIQEEYCKVDVVVNGTKFSNVGIRPKGNSSLTQVADSDSDRYSFRLQFDEYIEGQTCFGLESFVVNNMIGDNTYMKEYVSYEMMKEIGVETPSFQYADLSLNGETIGLYLAVELYNDGYEERVSGDLSGMLYNVKSMEMGDEKQENGKRPEHGMPAETDMVSGNAAIPQRREYPAMPEGAEENGLVIAPNGEGGEGKKVGNTGGSLQYTDDSITSYSAIFENVVGKGTTLDYQKVIKALKALQEGTELEEFWDVDAVLRYLAAHTIVVNGDSYSSNMAQNYYLYEKDGQITILPWDYNLAWGGMKEGEAADTINFPIDTPVSGVELSERPLIAKLLENKEYLERYHTYLQELLNQYFLEGKWETTIAQLNTKIADYVERDSTAFCTYAEYETAVATFSTLGTLRAQSIQGQLLGTIPSTTQGQVEEPSTLISGDRVSMNTLGSMNNRKRETQADVNL